MTYQEVINQTPVTLVEFFATWCPHCAKMAPIVDQIRELLAGRVNIHQFDIDKNEELADDQNVQGVPTFILYVDGREVWRHSGEIEANDLLMKIEQEMRK